MTGLVGSTPASSAKLPLSKIQERQIALKNLININTYYRIALDDEHRNQAAAQKLLMDRMLPISVCDKNADIREKITININSVEIPEREEKVVN